VTLLSLVNALLFAVIGVIVFAVSLVVVARTLPGNLWKQALVEKNLYAAIVLAGVAMALGWIIASAVH
jgi:cytochrome bd-type quinol oxidase subunit 1